METSITSACSPGDAAGFRASDFGGVVGGRLSGRGVEVSRISGVGIAAWVGVGLDIIAAGDGETAVPPAGVGETADGADRGSDTGTAVGSGLDGWSRVGDTVGTRLLKSPDSDAIGDADVGVEAGDAVGSGSEGEAAPHPANQNTITRTIKEMCSCSLINRFYQNRCNKAENGR